MVLAKRTRSFFLQIAAFVVSFKHTHELSIFAFTAQLGIGTGSSSGRLTCSFPHGFVVLGGSMSNLSMVRSAVEQQHFQLFDTRD